MCRRACTSCLVKGERVTEDYTTCCWGTVAVPARAGGAASAPAGAAVGPRGPGAGSRATAPSIERIKLVTRAAAAAPAGGFGRSRILVVNIILVREGEEEEVAEELGRVGCGARGEAQLDL